MSQLDSKLVVNLVSLISNDEEYTSAFYFDPSNGKCSLEETLSSGIGTLPAIIWHSEIPLILHRFVGEGLLVLACLPEMRWKDLLTSLSKSLRFRRQARVFIELSTELDESLVNEVLRFCLNLDMINVNAIFANFNETKTIYGYDAYPEFKMTTHFFSGDSKVTTLYPNKMLNLYEGSIRTMPDYSEPNTLLYVDKEGHRHILGYLWDMMEAYARKCNASLEVVNKYADGRTLNYVEIIDVAQAGVVDVSASIQPMSMAEVDIHQFSYPADLASWCTMLPVQRDLNVSEILTRVTPISTFSFIVALWIVYQMLKGRWGFHQRLKTIGWLFLVVLVSANYVSKLLTFLAAPPALPPLHSLQDLIDSPVRILSLRNEYKVMEFTLRTKYSAAFRLIDKATVLISTRNSLNTSFGYTTTSTKWKLFEEHQKRSSRPLFRYSKDICFFEMVLFGLSIPENSPHRVPLKDFIMQLWQSGLFNFWVSRGFSYMVKAGRIDIKDLRLRHRAHALTIADLRHVLLIYCIGMLISFVLFTFELIVSWVKSWLGF
ncbi:hypothetical protein KR074_007001 [Drosophila pseudoananassae]|nr:hypothetical protein KR074_007001 [Drosophila pseudoananassae]